MVIQENLPEGVNLPLEPFTVLYLIETLFTILYGYLKRAKQHNFINLEYLLKTKGLVKQCFLPHGKVMPDTSFELNLEWTSNVSYVPVPMVQNQRFFLKQIAHFLVNI